MAIVSNLLTLRKMPQVFCRKKEKEKERGGPNNYPYKVIDITPPPKHLGVRCFPSSSESPCGWLVGDPTAGIESLIQRHKSINLQCGESVTIEGQTYTISSVTHRYQLRKGKYEPSEKRLDVLSTGRYILNLYLESLLEKS